MPHSRPSPTIAVFLAAMLALFLVGPALAWGSLSGLLAHPARAGVYLVAIIACVAFFASGVNLASFRADDRGGRAVIAGAILIGLPIACLPAYADRREIAVWDGDRVRYTGLILYAVGSVLRIGPMFVLGGRFRAPWTGHDEHYLVTTGFYRYIRHPSYLGQFLILMGWCLAFRCWIGFLICCALILLSIPLIRKEEDGLLAEFGEPYEDYRRRTWLWPFIR